ncbi:MAG TPA: glycosyltransferase family 4 protein [Pyrinomonadaceae bacterium]|nr:glycosyltransferase family 4 protein [Pyrinomonadaceae bacterium]
MKWICCQLGAREHYAVPRALQLSDLLGEFITDVWTKRLTGRFHPGLAHANVRAPNISALTFALKAQATGVNGWNLITQRNEWFQQQALDHLHKQPANGSRTVFAYSYAAERIFKFARERGWRLVLGQIDPGPAEEQRVAQLHAEALQNHWQPAPAEYWNSWRNECALADQIVVNSSWSREALLSEGVPAEKVSVVPVAYEAALESTLYERDYPADFTSQRPLRVLFLGQINLRKGVGHLFDALKLLERENVEFWFVGPTQMSLPSDFRKHARVKWFGVVPRSQVHEYYKKADVFVFPTLSDGFGLTQLEAQSWKLPVVASRHCGEVVCDGVNGVILEEVSGQAIAVVLRQFLRSPEILKAMSTRSGVDDRFSLRKLAASLTDLGSEHRSEFNL